MIDGLYIGGIAPLPPEGQASGIFKRPAAGPVRLTRQGLVGDAQADRRVHGGPDKALHHYAAENYPRLAAAFPAQAAQLVPGSIGENLSTRGWTEASVCIGDLFRVGGARVQVSQPRSPCWKIDHKFAAPGMSRFIAEAGITGWYYRVVEEGELAPGDPFELLERPAPAATLARLWRVGLMHRPDEAELADLAATPGLAAGWVRKLDERAEWLRRHGREPT
jgi:MOSC domain-containing protein YiiM